MGRGIGAVVMMGEGMNRFDALFDFDSSSVNVTALPFPFTRAIEELRP